MVSAINSHFRRVAQKEKNDYRHKNIHTHTSADTKERKQTTIFFIYQCSMNKKYLNYILKMRLYKRDGKFFSIELMALTEAEISERRAKSI